MMCSSKIYNYVARNSISVPKNIELRRKFNYLGERIVHTNILLCEDYFDYVGSVKADVYYYSFINFRPMFMTGMGEKLMDERRKSRMIIEHILIYHDLNPEYREQIKIMVNLLETRKTQLSASIGPVNLEGLVGFAGLILSFTVVMIQTFYTN
ncbi:uncharacterized protein LOC125067155 isoform X2 [Vanessa atalanta]|uniref:uncharacterized protein LOC125067155 isoform X2 n=1 Tax=Vanessa atalanta TaxID=42275 RepID=UPI001FCDFFB2|nr:uncharacterized protein LOC125067155 isoform X2 [Vanessa atalanta]